MDYFCWLHLQFNQFEILAPTQDLYFMMCHCPSVDRRTRVLIFTQSNSVTRVALNDQATHATHTVKQNMMMYIIIWKYEGSNGSWRCMAWILQRSWSKQANATIIICQSVPTSVLFVEKNTNCSIFAVFHCILAFVPQLEGLQFLSGNITTLKRSCERLSLKGMKRIIIVKTIKENLQWLNINNFGWEPAWQKWNTFFVSFPYCKFELMVFELITVMISIYCALIPSTHLHPSAFVICFVVHPSNSEESNIFI